MSAQPGPIAKTAILAGLPARTAIFRGTVSRAVGPVVKAMIVSRWPVRTGAVEVTKFRAEN
jgi:hypothetical protein